MKRSLALTLALVLLLCALAGCGGGSKSWKGTHHAEIVVEEYGTITIEINADIAPITASNFLNLAKKGFYDGNSFYRVIDGFAIYGGDPNGNGTGTSGTTIEGEFTANGVANSLTNTRGAIGMARGTHYNSASCQFYILQSDATYLDGDFAVFGYVISGINVVDQICAGTATTGSDGYVASANQPVIKEIKVLD
ncbi:MAG: peptidylprolyl isomerase [Ruminococcaceae bacterium]|nr:peptidylprolyl isomerase [Oscillospiraceae bacterium]